MFRPDVNKVTKGMIFAGCSFTWGQGLYYYSNLPTLKEPPPFHYDSKLVRHSHYEFMKSVRYPRIVANHFNTFEICQPFNGGSTTAIFNHWNPRFKSMTDTSTPEAGLTNNDPKYDYEDFSCIIYQATQWTRTQSPAKLFLDENNNPQSKSHIETMRHPDFLDWLEKENITLDDYIHSGKQNDINNIKDFLKKFEDNGIKAYILTWPAEMVPYITADTWLNERFITFNYRGLSYTNIEDMMGEPNDHMLHPELTINTDRNNFIDTPDDHHPSLKCHRVIAENIIKRLENQ